ncbi:unnamed protein product [Paramecium pentaurelia]|uniref:PUM-HD domain-containing protein n=1 Tax=Paramecium pentaurelia TaxID=43138 RepID=A0A8S1VJM8_9CILI|nr:unnamed protein product [Paramecium pentaurelia]
MTDDDFETEQNLLGTILSITDENEYQDQKKLNAGAECNQTQTQTKFQRQYQFQTADSFSKSFEQISLSSDQLCSPISPDGKLQYKNPGVCTSFSSDNQTSLENSMIFGNPRCFDYFQKQPEQFSPIFYSQNNPIWPSYQKPSQNLDIQLDIDIENMCGNQILSRKVQKIFETGSPNQKQQIFCKVQTNCQEFSKDIFGNYLIQKILEKGTVVQQIQIFNQLLPYVFELSKNNFGCRVIQKLIDIMSNNDRLINPFIQEIKQNVQSLLIDQNGKYVILKCLENFQIDVVKFILKPSEELCIHMCDSQYGCKIIQKLIDNYPSQVDNLIQICISNQELLYKSQYGNHIIQYAIKQPKNLEIIANYIVNHLEYLCFNKYASNTVEAILEYLTPKLKNDFVQVLIKLSDQNRMFIFINIATNPFGNYVIKKLLQVFELEHTQQLLNLIRQNLNLLQYIKQSEYGQRIYTILTTQLNDQN